jgi:protein XagA
MASEHRRGGWAGFVQSVLAVVGACLWAGNSRAGAWLQPEGRGQIVFSPSAMTSGNRFSRDGRHVRIDRFVKSDTITLVEYGLRENLTLILATGGKAESYPIEGSIQTIATSSLGGGGRIALWRRDDFVLSAQATAASGLERSIPALDRRFGARHEADARLLAGYSFAIGGLPAFVEAQTGYRWRSGRHADEARLDLTVGIRPVPRLQVFLQSLNAVALQGDRTSPRDRPRQHKLQASAVFDMTENWSVQAGAFISVAGRSALKEQGVLLGVWRKF